MTNIGAFIAKRREELGLSRREVAAAIGQTGANISYLESGRTKEMKITAAIKLCQILQCSLSSLTGLQVPGEDFTEDEVQLIEAYRKIKEKAS